MKIRRHKTLSKEKQALLEKAIDKMMPAEDPFDSIDSTITNIQASCDSTCVADMLKDIQMQLNIQGCKINELYNIILRRGGL
jgi:hypothetical protein